MARWIERGPGRSRPRRGPSGSLRRWRPPERRSHRYGAGGRGPRWRERAEQDERERTSAAEGRSLRTRGRPGLPHRRRPVSGRGRRRPVAATPGRAVRTGQDEGGPGDSPVSVRWLQEGAPTRGQGRWRDWKASPRFGPGRAAEDRPSTTSARWLAGASPRPRGFATYGVGGPPMLDRPIDRRRPRTAAAPATRAPRRDGGRASRSAMRADRSNSIVADAARRALRPLAEPRRPGSTVGLSDWERWLELCARIDGFPRHLSIHSGGMLVTAAPLIDIAPIERATMADRVVVQFDKRDVETMKLIKLDLLGLGMLAAIDETRPAHRARLRRLPRPRPDPRGDPRGLRDAPGGRHRRACSRSRAGRRCRRCRSRGRQSLDDLVVEVAIIRPGPIQGNAVHPYLRRKQGLEPVTYLHPQPRAGAPRHPRRDPLPGAGDEDRDRRRGLHAGGLRRVPAGDGHVALEHARWRSSTRSSSTAACASRGWPRGRRGAVPPGARRSPSFGFAK